MDYLIGVGADREIGRLRPMDTVARAIWQFGSVGLPLNGQSSLFEVPEPDGKAPTTYLAVAQVFCDRGAHHVFNACARIAEVAPDSGLWVRPLAAWVGCFPDEVTAARAGEGADIPWVLPDPGFASNIGLVSAIAEVAPEWRHPLLHRTAAELLQALTPGLVRRLNDPPLTNVRRDVAE